MSKLAEALALAIVYIDNSDRGRHDLDTDIAALEEIVGELAGASPAERTALKKAFANIGYPEHFRALGWDDEERA